MRDALFSRSNTCSRAAGGGSGGRHVYLFAEYTVDNKRDGTRPGEFIAEGGEIGTKKKKMGTRLKYGCGRELHGACAAFHEQALARSLGREDN